MRRHPPSADQGERAPRPSLSSWTAPRCASPTADPASRAGLSSGLPRVRDAGCVRRSACGPGGSGGPPESEAGPLLARVPTQTPWLSP